MHIFLTGATGWVGYAVLEELVAAGYQVSGLVRSAEKASVVAAVGARPVIGTLDDLDLLCGESAGADAVIHTAFDHDFARLAETSEQERRALEAIGEAIAGFGTRLLVTSGLASIRKGAIATEQDRAPPTGGNPRQVEAVADRLAAQGVPASTVRLAPTVHGRGEHGFVAALIGIAREKGVSAYVGDGTNRWPAVHRSDVARLYRLAVEHSDPAPIYHAVAEEGVPFSAIAEAIGSNLGVPVEERDDGHFGWLGRFAATDMPASSAFTRSALGWSAEGPTLLTDLARPDYARADRSAVNPSKAIMP